MAPGGTAPPGTAEPTAGRAVLDAFGSYRDVLIEGVANLQVLQDDLTGAVTSDDQLQLLYEQLQDTAATQACARHILVQAGTGQSDATTGELIAPTEEEYEAALTEITGIRVRIEAGRGLRRGRRRDQRRPARPRTRAATSAARPKDSYSAVVRRRHLDARRSVSSARPCAPSSATTSSS